jgi:glucose/arabinose dehydrogenase
MAAAVLCLSSVLFAAGEAQAWPIPYEVQRFSGLERPLYVTGDGSGTRLYILEKGGRIWVTPPDSQDYELFLDLSDKVSTTGEQGLLGLAFSPDYASSREFYVGYTNTLGNTVIARLERDPVDPDKALPASSQTILPIIQPFTNHNGGWMAFGPDGYLYISSGDGGSSGDPQNNAQDLGTLLGKVLRIDVVGEATYAVPADNPFVGTSGARPEIWARGLRNPWRCSIDPSGNLWIGDVGQNAREEVDFQAASSSGGQNYGWNRWEGSQPYPPGAPTPSRSGFTFPVFEYRTGTDGDAVVGGYVYRGSTHPGMQNTYYAGDFGNGRIWGIRRSGSTFSSRLLLDTGMRISSFGEADDGTLFVCSFLGGKVYELRDAETYSDRLWAPDRYSTAVRIARSAYDPAGTGAWPGVAHVILASGEDRAAADPLAAAGLCWAYDAPLVLTTASRVPSDVRNAIAEMVKANGTVTLHVVGGKVSVPWARIQEIRAHVSSSLGISASQAAARVRYDRPTPNGNRYELAASIARRMQFVEANVPGKTMADAALIANGADPTKFFDPLALSPIAAANGAPILLVAKDGVPSATRNYLLADSPTEVVIGGGPATVSWSTGAAVGATTRWYGPDRYYTATAIANGAVAKGWLDDSAAGIAAKLPDAMTGGSTIGANQRGVLLITQGERLTNTTASWLAANRASITDCYVFGGPASIDDEVRRGIARALD